MKMMNIRRLVLLALAALVPATTATETAARSVLAPNESGYPQQIVRLHVADNGGESLQTPVARYRDAAGRKVDLVGAIHLADARYYLVLNRAFARYDKVLYEMLDGEDMPELVRLSRKVEQGTATEEEKRRFELAQSARKSNMAGSLLGSYYAYTAAMMKLSLQTEVIDYGRTNLVFADMSSEEFAAAMKQRGESWFSIALDAVRQSKSSGVSSSFVSLSDSRELRRFLCRQLANASAASTAEETAVVISRNEKCFEVLDEVLKTDTAARRIAIFYGAMHLRDMHERMLARGFVLEGVQWITAIRID